MADNVILPGTGATIGCDQVTDATLGSVQVQFVKIMDGTLDGTNKAAVGSNGLIVDGSAVTQPVSLASVPTHAVTQSGTWTVQPGNTANTTAWKVDGSAVTQPISASSLPLPSGASTSAKQPALGTAGSASSDVITVQGITSMTALKVDGSAVTQPVSGTFWQATQPVSGTVTVQQSTASSLKVDLSGTAANSTAIKVDNSAVTQPVSGTVTANAGTGNFGTNTAQINGATVSTAATGVQKIGIVGNAGATVDSTVGAGTAPTNAILAGSVYNSSAPAPTNGQAMALQSDEAGSVRISKGIALKTLSAWTSGTSLNATQTIYSNSGAEAVVIQLVQTTTLTAGAITFEVTYDGTNWVTAPANSVLDPTSTTFAQISIPYTVQASTNKSVLIQSNGWQGLRIKLSTQITGTGSVTPNYALLGFSPLDAVVALSPTAANFNATVSGTVTVQQSTASSLKVDLSGTAANATAIKVDGSAVTQPVSGTVTANAAQSGTWTVQPGNTANTTAWLTQSVAGTAGGWSVNSQTGLTNTKVAVKASAGNFGGYMIYNPNASVIYVQVFDVASASVTLGTTAPTYVIPIPATAGANLELSVGITHATAITLAATTTATGLTAPGTALTGFFLYK